MVTKVNESLEREIQWRFPDVTLGVNALNDKHVILSGKDRTLSTIVIGSVGTGKIAAIGLPMIQRDLDHMTMYINEFSKTDEKEDSLKKSMEKQFLSGVSIIEPSNDLCQKALQLVKAHGLSDEAVTYINPLDPNTPSINSMNGPVERVANIFTQLIIEMIDSEDGQNYFFEQIQKNHLKQYIYLLKLHEPEKEVTLDMLINMYNHPQSVRKMHVKLKSLLPTNIDDIEDNDERNYWKISKMVSDWFDSNILPIKNRQGFIERNTEGEELYFDVQADRVVGIRTLLNDMGANPLLRRVLFGKSNFDFDHHMQSGGILLVNTAKGELANMSKILGKVVLMHLEDATFKKGPAPTTFHHIMIDEASDYLYENFLEFVAQTRKYNIIVTAFLQTLAPLVEKFGSNYVLSLLSCMRNHIAFGRVSPFDAKYFNFVVKDDYSTLGECLVRIVVDGQDNSVVKVKANFVPKQYFTKSEIVVDPTGYNAWLKNKCSKQNSHTASE